MNDIRLKRLYCYFKTGKFDRLFVNRMLNFPMSLEDTSEFYIFLDKAINYNIRIAALKIMVKGGHSLKELYEKYFSSKLESSSIIGSIISIAEEKEDDDTLTSIMMDYPLFQVKCALVMKKINKSASAMPLLFSENVEMAKFGSTIIEESELR